MLVEVAAPSRRSQVGEGWSLGSALPADQEFRYNLTSAPGFSHL